MSGKGANSETHFEMGFRVVAMVWREHRLGGVSNKISLPFINPVDRAQTRC